MAITLEASRRAAAQIARTALVAFAALDSAQANHFILPCEDACQRGGGWVLTGSLNVARINHTATLLPDGQVLVAGGSDDDGNLLASAELFDPVTGTWSFTGPMTSPRAGHFAALLPNGTVAAVGGEISCCMNNITMESYDPASGTWRVIGNPGPYGGLFGATVTRSGGIFAAGATTYRSDYVTASWLFDPVTDTWAPTGGGPVYRQMPHLTLLPDGAVLVTGGTNDPDEVMVARGADLYSPATGVWNATGNPYVQRDAVAPTILANGGVLLTGGYSSLDSASIYFNFRSAVLRSCEVYESGGTWRLVGDLNEVRAYHTATSLLDGRVLVAGGWGVDGMNTLAHPAIISTTAELYDADSETWAYTGPLNRARMMHTATRLRDGSVLIVGGVGSVSAETPTLLNDPAVLASAEIYRPATAVKSHRTRR